jgi:hypothetical protein
MKLQEVVATELVGEEAALRLERAGYRPVVRWERQAEGTAVVLTSGDALVEVGIREKRKERLRLRRSGT